MATKELRSILVIEDDKNVQTLTKLALENIGNLEITIADNATTGLHLLCNERYDLVLLDHLLPDEKGSDIFKRIERTVGDLAPPILFFTALEEEAELKKLSKLRPLGIIKKPFEPFKLIEEIRGHWEKVAQT